jgi:hypothetical protein
MDEETIDEQVEEAAEHADLAGKHRQEERRLETRADTGDGSEAGRTERAADGERAAAEDEEDAAEDAADQAAGG